MKFEITQHVTSNDKHRTIKTVTKYGTYIYSEAVLSDEDVSDETKEQGRKDRIAELKRKHGR